MRSLFCADYMWDYQDLFSGFGIRQKNAVKKNEKQELDILLTAYLDYVMKLCDLICFSHMPVS